MARPEIYTLNSYAVSVGWMPPADLHSRRAIAMRRGLMGGAVGSALGQDVEPVLGYRLRYWERPCHDGQPPVDDFGTVPAYVEMEETWPSSENHAVLKWLVAGMSYVFEVMAFNQEGSGPWSDPSDCFIMPSRPEGRQPKPTSPSLQFAGAEALPSPAHLSPKPDSIEVSWAATCHRGAAISSYDILCSKDPDFRQQTRQLKTTGESTQIIVRDLEPNTVYYFKHRAVNEKGPSKWSERTPGVATKAKVPERPAPPVRIGEPASREISLKWEAPESYGVPIQHYNVRFCTHADMSHPHLVPVGADSSGNATANLCAGTSSGSSAPSSPAGRRPGFNKGHYALTQLRVKGLVPVTTYYFQVQALNQVGASEWSETSKAIATTACIPGRAGRPRFIAGTKLGGMRICWTVPECFGAPITRYDVRVSRYTMMTGPTDHKNVMTRPADPAILRFDPEDELLEATIPGCWDPAVDHFYEVRAVNAAGEGEWSETSEAMVVAPERPLRPEAPHSFESLHRTAMVRWKAPDCRGSPLIGYRLRYSGTRDMMDPIEVQGVYGTVTDFAVTGLHPHGTYFFQVCAVNAVGCSDWSPPSSMVKVRQAEPAKLSAPYLLRETSTTISVAFVNPADCGTRDGELIQTYVLYYAVAGSGRSAVELASEKNPGGVGAGMVPRADPAGVEVSDLRPGTTYQFQIVACNEYGDGIPSEAAEFTTSSASPEAPEAPWLVERTSQSITLAVKPGVDGGAPLTHLDMQVEESEAGARRDLPRIPMVHNDDGLQYYAVTSLRPGVLYRFRAATANRQGNSPFSEPSKEYSTESTPPEHCFGLRSDEVKARSYRLSWEEPYFNGSAITGYRVQWCQDAGFEKSVQQVDVTERSAFLEGCTPGMPTFARVAAKNAKGHGPYCDALSTDLGADVPEKPMHVMPCGVGPINVRLGWIMPYDCGSPITQIWVRYGETATDGRQEKFRDKGELLVMGRKRFCSIEPLFSSREYIYQVAAQNAIGIGPWSETSSPSRIGPPDVPTAPEKPIFLESTTTDVAFKWNASEAMGSNVLEQVVHIGPDPHFAAGSYLTVSMPAWSATKGRQVGRIKHGTDSPRREDTLSPDTLVEWDWKNNRKTLVDVYGSRPPTRPPSKSTVTTAAPGASRPTTITTLPGTAARASTAFTSSRPVTVGTEARPPSQQPIHVGGAEVLKLDQRREDAEDKLGEDPEDTFGEGEDELQMSYAQEVMVRRRSSSCGIDQVQLGCPVAAAATIGSGEDAPKFVQLAEAFDDIFPMQDEGTATMQRASCYYKRPQLWGEYTIPELHPGTHYYIRVAARNIVGLSPFGPCSERVATQMKVPWSIPEDPGVVLLRTGCTSLTFGWQKTDCQGMPVLHYNVRCSETEEGLMSEDCIQFKQDETERETWPGMIDPQPYPYPLEQPEKLNVDGKGEIVEFSTYLVQRFQTLEESWEWLDVNGNGEISKEEFLLGDEDDPGPHGGAPFEDFPGGAKVLEEVWKLLDADGGGAIGMSEWGRLRPFFDSVRKGDAGLPDFEGVYCLVPSLKPGQKYYFMVCAVNKIGSSPWLRYTGGPILTYSMTPASMAPLEAVRELRTTSSVTFTWELPWDGGNPLTKLEVRYSVRDVDEGVPDRAALCSGKLIEIHRDSDGQFPLRRTVSGLLPGQVVIAIARAFNRTGGSRLWSQTANAPTVPEHGHYQEAVIEWDCTTLPAVPQPPTVAPYFNAESLETYKGECMGEICFNFGRDNGSPYQGFDFEMQDAEGEVVRSWRTASSPEETAQSKKNGGLVRRDFIGLQPGVSYCVRARCINAVGASEWSDVGPLASMPPDVPLDPEAPHSEFTSLTWVELKFMPPHDNGAKIEQYSVRTTQVENAEEDDWIVLPEEEVSEHLRTYASAAGGRKMIAKDANAMLCKVLNLKTGTPHYFGIRARNSVGWSNWSETSCFVTKPARPGRIGSVTASHALSRCMDVHWEEPDLHDCPALRYELVFGSNLRLMRWAQLVSVLLCTTPDTDRLFGELCPPELGESYGLSELRNLTSEETLFLALEGDQRSHHVNELLAGQEYFATARVVTRAGRGEFSEIFGPFDTGPEKPCDPLPPEVQVLSDTECRMLIKLPYDNGLPILHVAFDVHRSFGPLSNEEVDHVTGDAKDHIARREVHVDPKKMEHVDPPGASSLAGRILPGMTAAMLRGYTVEGLGRQAVRDDLGGHVRECATGRQLAVMLEDLRPGTSYRVQWSCRNDIGETSWTLPEVRFETEPSAPDKPVSMEIHGVL